MTNQDAEFLRQLRAAFNVEAAERLQAISSGLLELEKTDDPEQRREIVANVFREAHSLKAAAGAVNLQDVQTVCQSLEGVLAAWRRHDVMPSAELLDPLHAAVSAVEKLLPAHDGDPRASGPSGETAGNADKALALLLRRLATLEANWVGGEGEDSSTETAAPTMAGAIEERTPAEPPPSAELPESLPVDLVEPTALRALPHDAPIHRQPAVKHSLSDTLRVSTAKLDALLLQAEEMLAVKLTVAQRAADVRAILDMLDAQDKDWARVWSESRIRSSAGGRVVASGASAPAPKGDSLARLLDWNREQAGSLRERVSVLMKAIDHERRVTAGMVDTLLESSKKLLMLPASTLLDMCPRLVRELSRELGKDVDLTVRGGEVEVDKRILEEMKDPLVHLLRNALDHGIEPSKKRAQENKPPRGTITLSVFQTEGNKVEIVMCDDGAGIDAGRVRSAAVRRGAISAEDADRLGERESLGLIFKPEVSTSPILTEISGRGLGMDIVKSKVEALGGRVDVETRVGAGTTFRLLLPLTLATFRGILIRSAGQLFVVPTISVERVVRVKQEEVKTVENRETLKLNDKAISFVRLNDVLELPGLAEPAAGVQWAPVVVLASGGKRIAFQVDAVLNEQEVLVKQLGMPLSRVRNVSGATVLGTGKAVPILNVDDLMKSAARSSAHPAAARAAVDASARRGHIMVAEDSITARMLVKNILESAGHRVKTAVDGLDALTALKTEKFDLVVSDVEMPRMDGFELTTRIRADAKLAELPVILVTALASPEHRERGVDVGADAYIVKGSFDQSDLLDAVRRLL